MNISYEWLKELVDINVEVEEIAKKFYLSGIEVAGIKETGIETDNIVVGEIKEIKKHPEADNLFVLKVDAGNIKQIITNLSTLKEGDKILVALEGAKLKSGLEVKKTKIKNIDSEGILVRWEDLGFELKGDYAIFIEKEVKNGKLYSEIASFKDKVIEVELTANRGDCLGMIGISREVVAQFDARKKDISTAYKTIKEKASDIFSVEINTPNCKRYCGAVIKNVVIKPSPLWMQLRLVKAGIRPINNIVDITNYVMLECNQPLHAFDMDKINSKKIIVRNGKKDEILKTLDNVERKIIEDDIIIADPEKGQCIGGIMGGSISEVTENTKNVFLEAAFFKHQNIRRTSKRLGLRSESSYRFERIIDLANVDTALKRALYYFDKLGIGEICEGIIDVYPQKWEEPVIKVTQEWINNKLGSDITSEEMKKILVSLGFNVKVDNNEFTIYVPSWRNDVSIKEDIAEEIARIYGYNNIKPTVYPSVNCALLTPFQKFSRDIRYLLYGLGCDETMNLSFVGDYLFNKMRLSKDDKLRDIVRMDIQLSDEYQGMRNSLIPGLIRTVSFNLNRQNRSLSLFEIGYVSKPDPKNELPIETLNCGVALAGIKYFKDHTQEEERYDFYDIKGIVEQIISYARVNASYRESNYSYLHPYRQANILVDNKEIGLIGELHPLIAKNFDIETECYLLEINLNLLFEYHNSKIKYSEIPKFPSSERDLALIVPEKINSETILKVVRESNIDILRNVRIFDIYRGENIPSGHYSIAINMEFNKIRETLTDKEVDIALEKILKNLESKCEAKLR
ncbi:MAG TPA: phenylalanine--tRNA ligase subunit beta [Spirochaetota bacterium]|nr:phenylalanine--tRNA ligase subunit beta [Spirochaetota bacterium]HOL57315.1 phenylalanine--tRNA ligase subunit beta [Spirochaetota bacterium]HPP04927.1 phenylalanine--tRNA ligase subunit beta [Spirochaetota bacterium]